MILLIITAAFVLNLTISLTGVTDIMTNWVTGLGLSAIDFMFNGILLIARYVYGCAVYAGCDYSYYVPNCCSVRN